MLNRHLLTGLIASFELVLASVGVVGLKTATAQDQIASISVSGLTNPRGFSWDAAGNFIIAEAGSGGDTEASGDVDVPPPTGPYTGGPTARVMQSANGCVFALAEGLPSGQSSSGEVIGVADVVYIGEILYALVSGGGEAHGNPDQPNGIYTIGTKGEEDLLVDLGQWLRDNPVDRIPEIDYDPEGSFFSLVAAPDGSALWVVESNSTQVLAVTLEGEVSRLVDLSTDNQVPTAIVAAPDGGFYLGQLTSAPFPKHGASVLKVDAGGSITTAWSGLTTITGLAVDADGTLYASQLSTTRARPPFLEPATGSIVRQTGESTSELVATGLNFPVSLKFGPDGALYVASPAIGASDGSGSIIRLIPGDTSIAIDTSSMAEPTCGDGTGLGDTNDSGTSDIGTTGDGTGITDTGSESTPVTAGEVIVRVFDFGFDNATLTIPVGTTVTWANTGAVQHTTVAYVDGEKYWDSGILDPGAIYSFTFTEAGTWDYACGLHPNMTGKIIVE